MCGNCGCGKGMCSGKGESCGCEGGKCEGAGCEGGKCESSSCESCGDMKGCGCCGDEGDMKDPKMMFMWSVSEADDAWNEMFREKLIEAYEKKIGKDMEKMAEFFVEQSMQKWMDEKKWHENKEKAMQEFQKMMEEKAKKKK